MGKEDLGASSGAEGWKDVLQCLLESGVTIQKKMESHPAMKKLEIFQRSRSASLGDTPKNQVKGEKRSAPSPPMEKTPKRGKGGSSPSYAEVATSQPPNKEGDWQVVTKKRKKKRKRRKKGEKGGTTARPKLKRSMPARSGDAIKVSAKDRQSYADFLREMKAKVDPRKAGLEVLSIRRTRKEEVLLVLRKGGNVPAFHKELDRMVGERA